MAAKKPQVAILMGSDSDWETMSAAAETLKEFGVGFEARVISCHRAPRIAIAFARKAEAEGFKVIIAGAGGAAHLPGVIAALTTLPVIGVPVHTSTLSGVDSLYSIVQMPSGVPVATMAIGKAGAKNAALLAIEMLALSDAELRKKLKAHKKKLEGEVKKKNSKLQQMLARED